MVGTLARQMAGTPSVFGTKTWPTRHLVEGLDEAMLSEFLKPRKNGPQGKVEVIKTDIFFIFMGLI